MYIWGHFSFQNTCASSRPFPSLQAVEYEQHSGTERFSLGIGAGVQADLEGFSVGAVCVPRS